MRWRNSIRMQEISHRVVMSIVSSPHLWRKRIFECETWCGKIGCATFNCVCGVGVLRIFERERRERERESRNHVRLRERQERILKDSTRLDEDYQLHVHQNQKERILQNWGGMKITQNFRVLTENEDTVSESFIEPTWGNVSVVEQNCIPCLPSPRSSKNRRSKHVS